MRHDDTNRPDSLSNRFRARRDVRLRELLASVAARKGSVRILDLGGSVEYWRRFGFDVLRENKAHVTVLNHIASELKDDLIDKELFSTAVGDACELDMYKDGAFDLIHSNSVIEHVGNWARTKAFAREVRRLSDTYYIQTPNFWFPIDPHYYRVPAFHWIPRPIQSRLLRRFPIVYSGRSATLDAAYGILDDVQLLDRQQMEYLFPDAVISREKLFGLTKSLIAIREP
jgi:hypothetical protein